MSGNKVLADTNIFIYLTQGIKAVVDFLQDKDISVSIITAMELLSYPDITAAEIKVLEGILEQCELIEITPEIMKQAILVRRNTRMKLPDAIIAATAQLTEIPLVTADKGFSKIDSGIILLEV